VILACVPISELRVKFIEAQQTPPGGHHHQPRRFISIGRWPAEVGYYMPIVSHNNQHLGHFYLGKSLAKGNHTQQKLDLISDLVQSLGDILYLNSKIQMN